MPSSPRHPHSAMLESLRQQTGRQHALLTGRGAAGIWAVLRALDIHHRAVLIPAHTCYIVLWAVLKSGNYPVLYDAEVPSSEFQVPRYDEKPAAIIPCHLYGLPAPMPAICEWAGQQGVVVIEDAALALGAVVEGKPAGSWGDASIFSFGQGKIADHELGGALLTDDPVLAKEVERLLADVPGWNDRLRALTNQWNGLYWPLHQYESQNPGLLDLYPHLFQLYGDLTVYRLPASHWRRLPQTLVALPENLAHRARLAAVYDARLVEINLRRGAQPCVPRDITPLQTLPRPAGSILWRYPLLVAPDIRDELLGYLWEQGIHDATRWYPSLRYMASALAPNVPQAPTPTADRLGESIVNLRLDSGVEERDVARIMGIIRDFLTNHLGS
jgi:dTDP-4-amino-4,6-dideoxygalactose transaminase